MNSHPVVQKHRGFALIATISVLLLLTLIAVAFLSLSAVTVRSSRIDWAQEEARANARLALMIALGELQREMGPDQRVSATASILDETPEQESISGVQEPHWLAVWSTNWSQSSTGTSSGSTDSSDLTPWQRDDENGGLRDRRFSGAWSREQALSSYLVSGNEGGRKRMQANGRRFMDAKDDGVDNLDSDQKRELVGDGSTIDRNDRVMVKAVNIQRPLRQPNGTIQDDTTGRYAFWIGDQGTKANISVFDRHSDEQPTPGSEEGYQRYLHAQDIAIESINGFSAVSESDQERLLSVRTAQLINGIDEDSLKRTFHDVTVGTRSVLANVRDSGLLKDLSLFFSKNADIQDLENDRLHYLGLARDDKMVGPANTRAADLQGINTENRYEEISPRFAVLQNWARDADSHGFSLTTNSIDLQGDEEDLKPVQEDYGTIGDENSNVYDFLLGKGETTGVKFTEYDRPTMAPVVVEAAIYYNMATRQEPVAGRAGWADFICLYPRVTLWNPYNVPLKLPPMLCQIFVNGNKELLVTYEDRAPEYLYLGFGAGNKGGNGNTFWILAANGNNPESDLIEMAPGETLVYTVDLNRSKRQGALRGDYSKTDYLNNLLTPFNPSSPDRYLLTEKIVVGGSDDFYGDVSRNLSTLIRQNGPEKHDPDSEDLNRSKPITYREEPRGGNSSGGDNYQFMLKDLTGFTGSGRVNTGWDGASNDGSGGVVKDLPLIAVGNVSLQAGGSDELPLRWAEGVTHPVYEMPSRGGPLTKQGDDGFPNRRTRDGFRLRWFDEHPSNLLGSSRLDQSEMEKLFQTAGIGNWNIRASYTLRNPFDNLTERAPYFFGNYTRDLFDDAVSWDQMIPRTQGNRQTGFPFGAPNSPYNEGPVMLFEVPSATIGIPNLAYLRNMKLSELAWHPTFPIGNSLADPRVDPKGTSPNLAELSSQASGGWNVSTMGTLAGQDSGQGADYWARLHRELLMEKPADNNVVYDLSYEANYNLWDTYMIASGTINETQRRNQMRRFADDPSKDPLPNGRYGLFNRPDLETTVQDDLEDFFRVAARLSLEGGFSVQSTSKEAWKAVLASTKGISINGSQEVVFPHFLNPSGSSSGNDGITADSLSGNRELTDEELDRLAEEIVVQVKKRAPFFGLADFVNRRLTSDVELARAGTIEVALDDSGVNSGFEEGVLAITDRETNLEDINFASISDTTRLDHRLKPASQAWGMPGYLTQGDVLSVIGSTLTARSDTFVIRAYGESQDVNGNILARAWCEATVQRTPEPVSPDEHGINSMPVSGDTVDFGRRFKIVGFRWLSSDEV